MKIKELQPRPDISNNAKLQGPYLQFENLLHELRDRELPDKIGVSINEAVEAVNSAQSSESAFGKQIKKQQSRILNLLEKELKLVPKNYYRNLWMALGMSAFGIPLGVAFGTSLGNMAFLGVGLPIGLALGVAVGTGMDKTALKEGRQLNLEIKK